MPSLLRSAVVTIGNFDGVHRGHQFMLQQVVNRARELKVRSCVVTFNPDPIEVLRPELKPQYLTEVDEKVRLMRGVGIDDVWVCQFDKDIAALTPEAFLALVGERHRIAELWVGADFALGKGRSGNTEALARIGRSSGWKLNVVKPLLEGREPVSSTRIRELLTQGDVEGAGELLGRPYTLTVDGESTNPRQFHVDARRALPIPGIYAGYVEAGRQSGGALVSITDDEARVFRLSWLETPPAVLKDRTRVEIRARLGDPTEDGEVPRGMIERAQARQGRAMEAGA